MKGYNELGISTLKEQNQTIVTFRHYDAILFDFVTQNNVFNVIQAEKRLIAHL